MRVKARRAQPWELEGDPEPREGEPDMGAKDATSIKDQDVIWFEELTIGDVAIVGGKNASLGEMVRELGAKGIDVPPGFATSADAFRRYIKANNLYDVIGEAMDRLDAGKATLQQTGTKIRQTILDGDWPEDTEKAIRDAYAELARRTGKDEPSVAVRSSATAEDLPDASFAGQQETFLNVVGLDELLDTCRRCYASLFTDRAITYRQLKGFDYSQVALSVGVQLMARSDIGGSGVMFSIDTESGFDKAVLINAAWGLGENVVQGAVNPDEYMVYKPFLERKGVVPVIEKALGAKEKKMVYAGDGLMTKNVPTSKKERASFVLNDEEIVELGRMAATIEAHYEKPMDMEWARDGDTGKLYIVQARPETVQSRAEKGAVKSYEIKDKGKRLLQGLSVGGAVATGPVCLIEHASEIDKFIDGAVLVTGTTDPDWVPIMKRASAIVTDHGGRTSHAAIVSRELGLPAIVGTGDATATLEDGQEVTVSCAEGDQGFVYEGIADIEVTETDVDEIPDTRTEVMLILANPAAALRWWPLPADGIGLARIEFIINNAIKIHPLALTGWDDIEDGETRRRIEDITAGWDDKEEFFVDRLARGIARIAASRYPHPVIVRLSDFKTNEYAQLIGGETFEPREPNPMLGWRGASRYYSEEYGPGFALECRALARVRGDIGLDNVVVMVPFCRTPEEGDRVLETMAEHGLARGRDGLAVYMMCEIPSNVLMAREFAERFDGFSVGSNDLTQLVLGVDRDSDRLAHLFDERSPAVKRMIAELIREAHERGLPVGLCGQAPSDHPDFARFLVESGIDSISVTPDVFLEVKQRVAEAERDGGTPEGGD